MKDIFLKLILNILKKLRELHNDLIFLLERMNIEQCEKTQKYKICHNRKKKQLFSIENKFLHQQYFHRKFISNKNEKNIGTYE